uniref:Uncharacterized protein n=1 Tax=Odontella aurita TaxID=265563 RepID=A0A7S4JNS0_9STRA
MGEAQGLFMGSGRRSFPDLSATNLDRAGSSGNERERSGGVPSSRERERDRDRDSGIVGGGGWAVGLTHSGSYTSSAVRRMTVPIPVENEDTYGAIRDVIRMRKRALAARRAAEDERTEARVEAVREAEERARKAAEEAVLAEKVVEGTRKELEALGKKRDEIYAQVNRACQKQTGDISRKIDEEYDQKVKETIEKIDKKAQEEKDKDDAEFAAKERDLLAEEEQLRNELAEIEQEQAGALAEAEIKNEVSTRKRKSGEPTGEGEHAGRSRQDQKESLAEDEAPPAKRQKNDEGTIDSGAEQPTQNNTELEAPNIGRNESREIHVELMKTKAGTEDRENKSDDGEAKHKKTKEDKGAESSDKGSGKIELRESKNSRDDIETPESKKKAADLEKIKSDLDSLNQTKSQMIWLLKQVITAENRRKVEMEKQKKKKEKSGVSR